MAGRENRRGSGSGRALPPVETRFAPGVSGNPAGRPKGSGVLTAALCRRLHDNPREVEAIIGAVLRKAKAGNLKAAEVAFDRADGKPAQSVELTGAGGSALVPQNAELDAALAGLVARAAARRKP
jgi:hypothetical protein